MEPVAVPKPMNDAPHDELRGGIGLAYPGHSLGQRQQMACHPLYSLPKSSEFSFESYAACVVLSTIRPGYYSGQITADDMLLVSSQNSERIVLSSFVAHNCMAATKGEHSWGYSMT